MDFVGMGMLFAVSCGAFELAVRIARSHAYVVAAGVGVGTAFLQTWVNLAVGIIGEGAHPGNAMVFGAMLIGLIAVVMSRLEPLRLAWAMELMTVVQLFVTAAAVLIGKPYVYVLTGLFAALWMTSAVLFRKAAEQDAGVNSIL